MEVEFVNNKFSDVFQIIVEVKLLHLRIIANCHGLKAMAIQVLAAWILVRHDNLKWARFF